LQTAIFTGHIPHLQPRSLIAALSRQKPFWPAVAAVIVIVIALSLATRPNVAGPVHVDEWTNLAYADALLVDGDLPHADPLYGSGEIGFRPETGFRVFLAELNMVTGLDWERMFPMLPALMMAMFVVAALGLGVSLRAGLFAGALAIGAPTTLRFLGPEYAAPVSLGLTLSVALVTVLLAPGLTAAARSVIAPALMAGLVLTHPPTALAASIAVAAIGGLSLHRDDELRVSRKALPALLTLLVPVIWFIAIPGAVRSELLGATSVGEAQGQGLITNYLLSAGYARISLMALSLFFLMARGFTAPKIAFIAGIGLTLGFARAHEMGIVGMANLYDRTWLYLDLLLVIGGAAGISAGIAMARERKLPRTGRWLTGGALATVVIVSIAGSVFARESEDVYLIGDSYRLEDFRWVRENLTGVDGLTLINPDIAISYPPVAGRPVFASSALPRPSEPERIDLAWELLDGQPDAARLRELGVGIVYTHGWNAAPGVIEVWPGVFVVDAAPVVAGEESAQ
jgi:hypothetical protein